MGSSVSHLVDPDGTPHVFEQSKFDPMFGFEETGRKKRVVDYDDAEVKSANIRGDRRDYCAKQLLEYHRCYREKFPLIIKCKHQLHAYGWCEYDDYVIRMKEYERERRLMQRAKRVGPERAGFAKEEVQPKKPWDVHPQSPY